MDDYAEPVVTLEKSIWLLHYHLSLKEFGKAKALLDRMEEAVRDLKNFCAANGWRDRYRQMNIPPLDIDLSKPL